MGRRATTGIPSIPEAIKSKLHAKKEKNRKSFLHNGLQKYKVRETAKMAVKNANHSVK